MKVMQDIEETIKKLLRVEDTCPACGCTLWNKKTFLKECINCSYENWFSFTNSGGPEGT